MKLIEVLNVVKEMEQSVQPTRESITEWYDWLSVIRDEEEFSDSVVAELNVEILDQVLGKLVLLLVSLYVGIEVAP